MTIFLIILFLVMNTALGMFIIPHMDNEEQTFGNICDKMPDNLFGLFIICIMMNFWFIAIYYAIFIADEWEVPRGR